MEFLLTFVARIQMLSTGGSLMEMLLKSLQVPWDVSVEKTWQDFLCKLNSGWIGLRFCSCSFCIPSNATPHECTGGWGAIFACHSPQKPPSGSIVSSPFGNVQTSARHPEKDWQACYQRSPCQTGFLEIGLPRSTRAKKTTGRVGGRRRILNWIPWCQEDTFRL